jgi:hypothetical protein
VTSLPLGNNGLLMQEGGVSMSTRLQETGVEYMAQSEKPVENILSFAKKCVPLHP